MLAALQKRISSDSYSIGQIQNQLSTDQSAQSTLTGDQTALKSDEQKIAQDNNSIASAKTARASSAMKDQQSLQTARQQVASAQLSLTSTKAGLAVKQAPPTPAALAGARASVVQAQITLANARKTLAETTLRAPIAGTVAAVNGSVGTQVSGGGSSGSSAASSSSSTGTGSSTGSAASTSSSGFVTLTGLTGMQLVADFAETDAAKLRPGQAATVTVDALPSEKLAAHVLSVAGTSTTSSSVVTYAVTFALDRSESGLKPGMTANVDVVIGEADNVLHVPTAAVRGSGSNATVTVKRKDGTQTSVPVVAGLQGDSATAILSGLKANQTVVLPSVSAASSGGLGTGAGGSTTSTNTGPPRGGGGAFFGGGFGG